MLNKTPLCRVTQRIEDWDLLDLTRVQAGPKTDLFCATADAPFFAPRPRLGRPSWQPPRFIPTGVVLHGGQSVLREALDTTSGAQALLKQPTELTPESRAQWEREYDVMQRLSSPFLGALVHGADLYEDGPVPTLALEKIEGEDLAAYLRREGKADLPTCTWVLVDVLKALEHVHEAGLVHCDLKPGNVMLTCPAEGQERHQPMVKLVDFGITRFSSGPSRSRRAYGSVGYTAPETLHDGSFDQRADLYAVAVLACQLLTGRIPGLGVNTRETMLNHARGDLNLPRWLDDGVWGEWLRRGLARDPRDRFQSAREMSEALCALLPVLVDGFARAA